ncbi:MAG: ferrous iron transport protein A [Candidatus Bathyarchaeota archaeon]|nr:MAG: ferrous iron transport protein A [Candidatus Bathyarchaeota archaeon]
MDLHLTQLRDGESGVILSFISPQGNPPRSGQRKWSFQRRLEDMGITPGTRVRVVKSAPFRGPIELQVRGSRLAIGRGMARKILVRVER